LASRFVPSEAIRRYMRMAGQPLQQRYRGVCRGTTPDVRAALLGPTRAAEAEHRVDAIYEAHFAAAKQASPLNRMLYVDAKLWLPDNLLLKADKMTMANSIELRVPFLDHEVAEFSATLPGNAKLRNG